MMLMSSDEIIQVLLPAFRIPDGSVVSKRTGMSPYALKHSLKVFRSGLAEKLEPLVIQGFFLVNERGDINQIGDDTPLHWHVSAGEFSDQLQEALGRDGEDK